MSLAIVNARNYSIKDEEVWMLAEIETHPRVLEWDTDIHTKSLDEMFSLFKTFFKKLPDDENQIFLVGKLGKRVIGFIGVHHKSERMKHVGVIGITVHPDYWNRSFGTELLRVGVEVARKEGLMRLEADTLANNRAMIRIGEKNGFSIEGTRKMRVKMNYGYVDEVLLGKILR